MCREGFNDEDLPIRPMPWEGYNYEDFTGRLNELGGL